MIKFFEFLLNIVHYGLYRLDYRVHKFSNRVNPFILLGTIPAVRKRLREKGTSLVEITDQMWTDKRFGLGIMLSGGALAILLFFVIWTTYLIANYQLGYLFQFTWKPFSLCMALSYLICHRLVFRHDKYLEYFKRFEKWTKRDKWKYGTLFFSFVIFSCASFIISFRFLG